MVKDEPGHCDRARSQSWNMLASHQSKQMTRTAVFFSFLWIKGMYRSNRIKHNTGSDSSLAYPLGGGDPQTVFVCLKTTDVADLGDKVDVFPILGLLTLASLVFPIKVVKAAGQDKELAGVRWPAERENNKIISSMFGFNNQSWSFFDRLTRHPVRCNSAPRWLPAITQGFKRTRFLFPLAEISWHLSYWMRLCLDDSPGCYNWDPRCELIWVVPNQPVRSWK